MRRARESFGLKIGFTSHANSARGLLMNHVTNDESKANGHFLFWLLICFATLLVATTGSVYVHGCPHCKHALIQKECLESILDLLAYSLPIIAAIFAGGALYYKEEVDSERYFFSGSLIFL